MVEITAKFWTDDDQARERLRGSILPVGDSFALVQDIENGEVLYEDLLNRGMFQRKALEDASWGRFRKQAPCGWRNISRKSQYNRNMLSGGIYLQRRAVRTRTHGVSSGNSVVYDFFSKEGLLTKSPHFNAIHAFDKTSIVDLAQPPAFLPAYQALGGNLCVALSPKWALYRDKDSLVWLYRKMARVGLVIDATSVALFRRTSYLREEIEADPVLPLEIKEL